MYERGAEWGTRVNSSKSKWPHGRRSQEVPMPPALAAFFFSFDFDFIFIFILSSSLSFVVPFALSLSFNYGMHTTAISIRFCFVLHRTHKHTHTRNLSSLLFSSAHLHYQLRTYKITRDTLWRVATHRILCLSLFLCLRFYSLNRQRNWPKTATKRKQNKICFYLHTYISYIHIQYNTRAYIVCVCVCR